MDPMETKELKPTFSRKLQSRIAVQSAPLWLMKPTLPGRAIVLAKVAFNPLCGTITPRQFGPTIRILPLRASSMTCCSNSTPAAPVSLNPAEIMTAPGTPASTHSLISPGTDGRRRGDHRQIHLLRNGADARVGLDAQHARTFRVDRVNRAFKSASSHVLKNRPADTAFVLGGADDRHHFRRENRIQRMRSNLVKNVMSRFNPLFGWGPGEVCMIRVITVR